MTKLFSFLGGLIDPSSRADENRTPESLSDAELLQAAARTTGILISKLGPIVQTSFGSGASDDPDWHRQWPTTVEMFIRSAFMTSFDAFGTAVIGLVENASAASTGLIRTVAECHVQMTWILDGATPDEQRGRVLAATREQVRSVRKSLGHWERMAAERNPALAAHLHGTFDPVESELEALARRRELTIPNWPERTQLFDRYLPGGYFVFALLSNMGSHPGSPSLFYGVPGSGTINWDYKGLHVERAFWLTKAIQIQVDNCWLAAPVCGWTNHQDLLQNTRTVNDPLVVEAEKRVAQRRDPSGRWFQVDP